MYRLFPDERITKILVLARLRRNFTQYRVVRILDPCSEIIVAGRKTLGLYFVVLPCCCSVYQRGNAVIVDSTARKAPGFIRFTRRGRKCDRFVLPVNQVTAGGMSPVHVSPERTQGVVLIEQMV